MTNRIKASKADAGNAERAAEHFGREVLQCVETRRMIRTRFFKVDFFGADVVGKKSDGSHIYIQVTSGQDQAVTARRRKLESHIWHFSDIVLLLQMVKTKIRGKMRYEFRVREYKLPSIGKRFWPEGYGVVEIKREWFMALKDA